MLASPNQDFGNHETIHKRAAGKFRPATNPKDAASSPRPKLWVASVLPLNYARSLCLIVLRN